MRTLTVHPKHSHCHWEFGRNRVLGIVKLALCQ
jgi:hypothetical protein